ncbi:hypothetical protein P3S67_006286 [Capsicum chacoense]
MVEELTRSLASHNLALSFCLSVHLHYFHLTKKNPQNFNSIPNCAMESSDSANKISKKTSLILNLTDQTNSRRRMHAKMFITLFIFFIVIMAAIISILTMIKQDYGSELPANNPEKAIQSICMPTVYYDTCFKYLSNHLFKNHKFGSSKITSSQIFSISLHTAIDELQNITNALKSYQSTARWCNYMYFNSSLSRLNSYLAINEEKNSTAIMTMRAEMIDWLYNERFNITGCLNWLAYEKGLETENANNCLSILENMNNISEMLDPSINSVFDFDAFRRSGRSIVDLLFSDWAIFGVQFIYWMLLVCMLVRAW